MCYVCVCVCVCLFLYVYGMIIDLRVHFHTVIIFRIHLLFLS